MNRHRDGVVPDPTLSFCFHLSIDCCVPDKTGELAQRADLSLQQDADIARRSLAGIWAGLGLVQFALLAGTYSRVHMLPVTIFAATTMGAYLVRLFLILRKNVIYPRNPRAWRMRCRSWRTSWRARRSPTRS